MLLSNHIIPLLGYSLGKIETVTYVLGVVIVFLGILLLLFD